MGKRKYDAVAIHDGTAWRFIVIGGKSASDVDEVFAAPANRLPQELVDKAARADVRRVCFALAGDMHRIEGAIPKHASIAKAREQMRLAIAETTGVDADDESVVFGMTYRWPGVRKPFTLAGLVSADAAADFHAALSEAGILCGGFASLEMALLAVAQKRLAGRDAFASVTAANALVVPAPRGANNGPQTAACGLRHFATDADNWLTRFSRIAAATSKHDPLHLLVLGANGGDVAGKLAEAGYEQVVEEKPDEWLADVAKTVAGVRANRLFNVETPVANPWEPRRKFSNAWIVAAALAILLLPAAYRFFCVHRSHRICGAIAAETSRYKKDADKASAAQKALAKAKTDLAGELAEEKALVGMRRPLVSFIDVAYLFCKHASGSTMLKSIVQREDKITVEGTFADPEDGVRLNKAVLAYAKEKNIEIVENAAEPGDGDGEIPLNRFRLVFDCTSVGRETK